MTRLNPLVWHCPRVLASFEQVARKWARQYRVQRVVVRVFQVFELKLRPALDLPKWVLASESINRAVELAVVQWVAPMSEM